MGVASVLLVAGKASSEAAVLKAPSILNRNAAPATEGNFAQIATGQGKWKSSKRIIVCLGCRFEIVFGLEVRRGGLCEANE